MHALGFSEVTRFGQFTGSDSEGDLPQLRG
jgi:hypothetical protein